MNIQVLQLERDSLNTKISLQMNELVNERDLLKKELAEAKETIERNSKKQDSNDQLTIWKEIVMSERDDLKEELNNKTTEVVELKHKIIEKLKIQNQLMAQLMNANDQQQKDREEIEKLRSKFAEVKEELKKNQRIKTMESGLLEAQDVINKQQDEMLKIIRSSEELECQFKIYNYSDLGSLYTCEVTLLNDEIITRHSGVHLTNKNDNDVKAIYMFDPITKFIPDNLGLLFNLKVLYMYNTCLIEIKSTDFNGMQELEDLYLEGNGLTSLPVDVFSTLPKLRFINLGYNQIQELPKGLFDNNLDLEQIHLYNNEIKFIATGLFNNLQKLNTVDFRNNKCLSKHYYGASEMTQLKQDVKDNYKN